MTLKYKDFLYAQIPILICGNVLQFLLNRRQNRKFQAQTQAQTQTQTQAQTQAQAQALFLAKENLYTPVEKKESQYIRKYRNKNIDTRDKNLVFLCCFTQNKYLEMLFLVLESIYIYGGMDNNIDILIYTSSIFMDKIKKSSYYKSNIHFMINDTFDNIDKACKARLDLFEYKPLINYKKILYIDTDVLINGDLNEVFNIPMDDKIYALEEGTIDSKKDFWGRTLFGNELKLYSDKRAFSSGILLFRNTNTIKRLFSDIKKDMLERQHGFMDQPFIVYNCFKYNLYNNQDLKKYVVNNSNIIYSDRIIHHFPGGPGNYGHKLVKMNNFLLTKQNYVVYQNISLAIQYSLELFNEKNDSQLFIKKAENISYLTNSQYIHNILILGFDEKIILLILITNPIAKITCYESDNSDDTNERFNALKAIFRTRIDIKIGMFNETLSESQMKYDLICLNGIAIITKHCFNSLYQNSKERTIFIFNDYKSDVFVDMYKLKNMNTPFLRTVKNQTIKIRF